MNTVNCILYSRILLLDSSEHCKLEIFFTFSQPNTIYLIGYCKEDKIEISTQLSTSDKFNTFASVCVSETQSTDTVYGVGNANRDALSNGPNITLVKYRNRS